MSWNFLNFITFLQRFSRINHLKIDCIPSQVSVWREKHSELCVNYKFQVLNSNGMLYLEVFPNLKKKNVLEAKKLQN